MSRWNYNLVFLTVTGLFVALWGTACIGDPDTEVTLQVTNSTDHPVRVTVPRMWDMPKAPPHEEDWMELTVEPGDVKEARKLMHFGSYPGPVRAYSQGRLIFCQKYDYEAGWPAGVTWKVEIVEGHIACQ